MVRMTSWKIWLSSLVLILFTTISPARSETFSPEVDDLYCLALNVFWESRSEPVEGQMAVAAVTLNRVKSDYFPDSICEVVKQGGYKVRHRCQFSWWCDGKRDEPKEIQAWAASMSIAVKALYSAQFQDPTNGAVFYHADYVNPYWAAKMDRLVKIGRHIFYIDDRHAS